MGDDSPAFTGEHGARSDAYDGRPAPDYHSAPPPGQAYGEYRAHRPTAMPPMPPERGHPGAGTASWALDARAIPGEIRPTGVSILLMIVTLGLYTWFWFYGVHSDMRRHRNTGLSGGVALALAIFVPIVLMFLTPSEVGAMYEESGRKAPVSGVTGLWTLLPIIGGIVWFVKVNSALNDYWKAMGAHR